jgi:hypothetical protein
MTAVEVENLAASHSDNCASTCAACLSRDLQAKARVVRINTFERAAVEAEVCAKATRNGDGARALRHFAEHLRSVATQETA